MLGILFAVAVLIISYFAGNKIFNFLETSFTDRHIWGLILLLLGLVIIWIIRATLKEPKEESIGKILRKSLTLKQDLEVLNNKLSRISAQLEKINEKLKKS